ncbi:MAG: ribosomal-processing cysteine protease Prp [Clostridiales bacterium]|jgi:uncharacterized protein YsxB (DUF464 family)|uniref:ribosomal-processing cysteine protease Prp n=1 Tax=Bovifimicola ammoniilytica TaxID=2981720 RepID=UPI000820BB70|nr:ribosomal-processing cysteine protease Prp [Bovifimicola ammoniilytica]MBD8941929.1 ribosomal-processing cysteine protease Prp [Clostridiales bacterium]MCU6753411.1 ribosomal-processing cysteine protease Prp [Bovifimicola ammoniilytica]SCJ61680.1 Predicted ribosomal protein [uncultured Eubacterium sp.]
MINVTIYKDSSDQFVGFEFDGHAEADEYGRDIVCAAASVLSINTINSIEEFTDDAFECNSDEESGYLMFRLTEELSNESKILMKSLVRGVKDIQKDNEKYIKIVFKEV